MVILRRTNRLRSLLPESEDSPSVSDTALGDWYVNRIVVHRKPLLLLVSSRSLLPLVVPARDVRTLPDRLAGLVGQRLARLVIPQAIIQWEIAMMAQVIVQKTIDRAVLGILVDFAKAVPHYLDNAASNDDGLASVEDRLEETPCFSGRRFEDVVFPRDKTARLLEQRWSAG